MAGVRWGRVAAFYAIACLVSWPFFLWRDSFGWRGWPLPAGVGILLLMWGPGVAALVAWRMFGRDPTGPTLVGSSVRHSLLAALTLLVSTAIMAMMGRLSESAFMLALFPLAVARTLGEELGWRGFLHAELRPLGAWGWVLTGILWEAWHLTARTTGRTPFRMAITLAVTYSIAIIVSIALGWAVARTGSILVAVAGHGLLNGVFEALDAGTVVGALAEVGAAGILIVVVATWPRSGAHGVVSTAAPGS